MIMVLMTHYHDNELTMDNYMSLWLLHVINYDETINLMVINCGR